MRLGFSPVLPTVASFLLAALWGLSVFAGWGLEAFCADGEASGACAERLATSNLVSGVFAVSGGACTAAAWFSRRDERLFDRVMAVAVAAWVMAVAVLFLGGLLAG
ncbi:hypothetical protein ACIBG7_32135 [Nonomuraea sp. NPDC050328]|uniref:hypothetical protein n=1 Tax=Nonomuraea sp. NPDC050328 TaxID=3364361 RepID=UPI0037A9368C